MNCFRNTDVIKTVLELVSCVWEKRVFPQAQVPYFCFTSRKLILKPKGLLLSAPLSPAVQSGRGQTPMASCHSAVGFPD